MSDDTGEDRMAASMWQIFGAVFVIILVLGSFVTYAIHGLLGLLGH